MEYFFSLFSLSKVATSSALNWSELVLFIFGIILVVGLVGEYKTPDPHSRRMKICEMLVIVGVLGELVGDGGIFLFSHQLQVISDSEISDANKRALDAKTSATEAAGAAKGAKEQSDKATSSSSNALTLAKGARKEADTFESDIVSAKTQAASAASHLADALQQAANAKEEVLRVSRELARLKTPRSLSESQQEQIASKIKPFPGVPFDLWVSSDSDSTALMQLMDMMLRSNGWIFHKPEVENVGVMSFNDEAGIVASSGIAIRIPEEHLKEWLPAVLALRKELNDEGLPTLVGRDTKDSDKVRKRDRIHITIGSKPLD